MAPRGLPPTPSRTADWSCLPPDVIGLLVGRLLAPPDAAAFEGVCAAWRAAARAALRDDAPTLDLSSAGRRAPQALAWAASRYGPALRVLRLEGVYRPGGAMDAGLASLLARCPGLTHVSLERNRHLSAPALAALAAGCPALSALSLLDCPQVGDGALAGLLYARGPQAAKMELLGLHNTSASDPTLARLRHCPALRAVSLGVDGSGLALVGSGVTDEGLRAWLGHGRGRDDGAAQAAAPAADSEGLGPGAAATPLLLPPLPLTFLSLRGRRGISSAGVLLAVLRAGATLLTLDLCRTAIRTVGEAEEAAGERCWLGGAAGAPPGPTLPSLRRLSLAGTQRLSDAGAARLAAAAPQLAVLDISEVEGLTDAGLLHLGSLAALRALRLARNGSISAAGLRACAQRAAAAARAAGAEQPVLVELAAVSCRRVRDAAAAQIRAEVAGTGHGGRARDFSSDSDLFADPDVGWSFRHSRDLCAVISSDENAEDWWGRMLRECL